MRFKPREKKMKMQSIGSYVRSLTIAAALLQLLMLFAPDAAAVPSFSRRYGMECSGCHTMWGALNASGVQFRLSGYRPIGGRDIKPVSEDIQIARGVTIPTTLP